MTYADRPARHQRLLRPDIARNGFESMEPWIDVPKEYLLSLKSSAARDITIDFIHVNPSDDELVNSLWTSLKCQLSEDDVQKYKALMEFGRGYTQVCYLGK
jgi:hypothetical protein